MNVEKMVMVTFIKLLVINIVAKNCFGFSRNSNTNLSERREEFSNSFMSFGKSEKKAVSLAEARAENSKSTHKITRYNTVVHVIPRKNCGSAIGMSMID
jgi:hypothetical protein